MRLKAVDRQENQIWEEDIQSLTAQDRYAETKGKTNLIDERIEQEAWES